MDEAEGSVSQELDDIRKRALYARRRSSHTTAPADRFDWERIAEAYGEIAKALERLGTSQQP